MNYTNSKAGLKARGGYRRACRLPGTLTVLSLGVAALTSGACARQRSDSPMCALR
jgi:hypothetical protein